MSEPVRSERERKQTRRFSVNGHRGELTYRHVVAHNTSKADELSYPDNNVSTTKYTRYNFLFKNLMEQFSRIANVYFLVISVLTSLDNSPKDHISLIGTFLVVLSFTALREAYEDVLRHRSDMDTNNQRVSVLFALLRVLSYFFILR